LPCRVAVSLTVLLHAAQEKENDEWKDLQELMETPEKNRLSIKLDNVRDFDAEMYDDCHNRPSTVIPAYEKAMNDLVRARERTP
jgi:DNA replicative helicase MCM subunit Mcm2 (Cdc46/Mcm family)